MGRSMGKSAGGRFGCPEQDRAPSPRGTALVQTLSRGHKLVPRRSSMRIDTIAGRIGNAVHVVLGKAIALSIKRHLVGHDGGV